MRISSFRSWTTIPVAIAFAAIVAYFATVGAANPLTNYAAAFAGTLTATMVVAATVARETSSVRFGLPSIPLLFAVGSFLALVVAALPTFGDQRYMRVEGAVEHYALALLAVGIGLGLYVAGALLVRTVPISSQAPLAASAALFNRVLLSLFVPLMALVWYWRFEYGQKGHFSAWTTADALVDDTRFGLYALQNVRWILIPFMEYFRSRSGRGGRRFWTILGVIEVGSYIISNERTGALLAGAQLGIARAFFDGWTRRRVVAWTAALGAVFFLLVNPAVYLMREEIVAGAARSDNQVTAYTSLFLRSVVAAALGEGRDLTSRHTERDMKGRMSGLDFMGALLDSDARGTLEYGWGEYALRNLASIVPAFLWSDKAAFALANLKVDTADRMGIPPADYLQTLLPSAFGDFWWAGAAVIMFLAGLFDGWIWRRLAAHWHYASARIFYFALLPTFLWPVEYVAEHFVGKFRLVAPLLLLLLALERWSNRARAGPADAGAAWAPSK